jgi:hypothetical protein
VSDGEFVMMMEMNERESDSGTAKLAFEDQKQM